MVVLLLSTLLLISSQPYLEAAHNQAPGAHSGKLGAAGSNNTPSHGLVGEHHLD
jgi:hypothetical protein